MKLNTLKEMDLIEGQIHKDSLKKEAIQWYNKLESELHNNRLKGLDNYNEKIIGLCATQEWIKHFFNITEEELNTTSQSGENRK